ncbi:MAG: hypothetical protein M3004_09400 [Bacteroidota bacterium]|nr:hypothetical protein [Bacteroidota bacterium]
MQSSIQTKKWSITKKIWMLFAGTYFFILMLDFSSSDEIFPHFVYWLLQPYTNFWDWIVPWTGKHILHLNYPITVKPNGSGDTTYNYVLELLWIVFAFIIAIVWALADRKRRSYNQLFYWIRIVVRYYLAFVLFSYGFVKIIKLQFPFPDLFRLTETYGDSSPMGLAWTFIGYSKGYNIFIGSAEVLAGVFLFFKRTTLVGALIAMTVMMNVAAMNFAYDIPVKIFSINLVIIATWIAWYDIERLINFFILNKTTAPAKIAMPLQTKWKRILQRSLKVLAILFAIYSTLWSSIGVINKYGDSAPKPSLYGIYDIETFIKKGDTIPPLATDTVRWKRMIISYPGYIRIATMPDSIKWFKINIDTVKRTAALIYSKDSTQIYSFNYSEPDKQHLFFNGNIKGDSVIITMKRFDLNNFNLIKRGYHWISEYPYNR